MSLALLPLLEHVLPHAARSWDSGASVTWRDDQLGTGYGGCFGVKALSRDLTCAAYRLRVRSAPCLTLGS